MRLPSAYTSEREGAKVPPPPVDISDVDKELYSQFIYQHIYFSVHIYTRSTKGSLCLTP
jgi:hypothetical protein